MEVITIVLCLWAIVLETQLKRRDRDLRALAHAINAVAFGKAKVTRKGERITITFNKEGAK